jgi:2-methylcitrate dehydratase PrpD
MAKRTGLDCLAAALAGCSEPGSRAITGYVRKLGGNPQAGIIGGGFRAAVPDAALANGAIAHALDYDDCGMKVGHPSVLVLPAALSLGDHLQASGKEVLTAYILGLEVQGKVALCFDFKQMARKLSSQCWYGCLGAAATAAKLLRLDVASTRVAMGIAANLACGLSANHGTMVAPMTAGNACRNGVAAALMAVDGVTASPDIIEAKNGFCDALADTGSYDAGQMAENLGNPFYILSPGIGIKKYPSCYHTPRAIEAVLQLLEEHRLTDRDIALVEVGTSERARRVIAFDEPATPYQGKYSMPHCIAAVLVDGKVTLDTFTPEKIRNPQIVEARKKVRLTLPDLPIWPGLADLGPDTQFVGNPVTIHTKDGRSFSARVDVPRGDPALPLTDQELMDKYAECAGTVLPPEAIQRSQELMLHLEKVANVRQVMDIMTAATPAPVRPG